MRWKITIRALGFILGVSAVLAVTSASALAMQPANADGCPAGRVGLSIQWADSFISYACSLDPLADKTPSEVLGLVVRWSDGSVSTVDLPPAASTPATPAATSSSSSLSTSSSTSISSSTSTSTTCVNGQCTTTTSHSDCTEGDC
jgi:hypothetical protein